MTAKMKTTMRRINVRFPTALMAEKIIESSILIVLQDCASLKTRNCRRNGHGDRRRGYELWTQSGTHQTKDAEHRERVDLINCDVHEASNDNDQVENVPSRLEVLLAHGTQFEDAFQSEDSGEDLKKLRLVRLGDAHCFKKRIDQNLRSWKPEEPNRTRVAKDNARRPSFLCWQECRTWWRTQIKGRWQPCRLCSAHGPTGDSIDNIPRNTDNSDPEVPRRLKIKKR